jgi:phosphate-selective porin
MIYQFKKFSFFLFILSFFVSSSFAKELADTINPQPTSKPWYENFSIRGYAQVRYNKLFETNSDLKCEQCDKSWGGDGGLFIRRTRIIFSGNISDRVYLYIQPDFASAPSSGSLNFAQLRDAYFDVSFDKKKEYRLRVGQSKVPYGFENMQSSQNRLPLDRNDALNSGVANERDIGAFFYWAPEETRKLFTSLIRDGLKGSGDYGVLGFGVFNGQTANKPEQNDNLHIVARFSYPIEINNQIIEPGIQAYTGKYVVTADQRSSNVTGLPNFEYTDQRVAASFVLYPKPFGIQAEYNIGTGPEYDKNTNSIVERKLKGGYITASYLTKNKDQFIIPFSRITYYDGGKKHEFDARSYRVNEFELGLEWQPNKNLEFVAMYTISNRRFEDSREKDNFQKGSLLRLQAQVNF